MLVMSHLGDKLPRKRRHNFLDVLNAISYIIKTGCQWRMLPHDFPHWKIVYHHFRGLSDRGWFTRLLSTLTEGRRASLGDSLTADSAVIDSQSVRSGLPQSEKGIDGHKRIKGIKRHLAVDPNGYPLAVNVTTANVHDSKGAIPLLANLLASNGDIGYIKTDQGYRGSLESLLPMSGLATLECVKSNFGTSEFIPMDGRWVVERTFSWMENYRRLCRNYERKFEVARHVFIAACVFVMLRYF